MYTRILLTLCLVGLIQCQDYDQDDLGRRLHRRPRPSYQNQGPCGRDANGEGRFFNLQYVNLNYNYNCGGGYGGQGHYQQPHYPQPQPQQPIHRPPLFSGGGGHFQKPQRPFKPQRPILGNLFGQVGHGGLGQHGGGFGQHGGGLGQLGAGLGQYAGGAISNVVPSVTGALQDAASQAGNYLNRPNFQPFRPGSGNGGPLGLGAFDGSLINSFVDLFRPNTNRPVPSSPSSTGVQYLDEVNNNNVNNNNSGSIDEKPVHEDPDEIVEAYSNSKTKKMISAFGPTFYAPYNRIIRGINKEFIHLLS